MSPRAAGATQHELSRIGLLATLPGATLMKLAQNMTREELPAATASAVTVTVTPKKGAPDAVVLQIDDSGESWVGQGREVVDPDAIARIAYTAHGKPYFIDVPFPR